MEFRAGYEFIDNDSPCLPQVEINIPLNTGHFAIVLADESLVKLHHSNIRPELEGVAGRWGTIRRKLEFSEIEDLREKATKKGVSAGSENDLHVEVLYPLWRILGPDNEPFNPREIQSMIIGYQTKVTKRNRLLRLARKSGS